MEKCFKRIEVNNQRHIELLPQDNGIKVVTLDSNNEVEKEYVVSDGDIVMLLNYYQNCKSGNEKSDYIIPATKPKEKILECKCRMESFLNDVKIHNANHAYTSLSMIRNNLVDLSALLNLCDDLEKYGHMRQTDEFAFLDATELINILAEQCHKMEIIICNSMQSLGMDTKKESGCLNRTENESKDSIRNWASILENKNDRLRPVISWLESEGMNISDYVRHQKTSEKLPN